MHLVEICVIEHRYQAVMAVVQDGWKVTEVADRLGVSRQAVHKWISRYEQGGLPALADRSHRPQSCAHQISAELEALICEHPIHCDTGVPLVPGGNEDEEVAFGRGARQRDVE